MYNKVILVTGAAGFIGSNLINELLKNENVFVIGIDNLNTYYNIHIKLRNIQRNKNSNSWNLWRRPVNAATVLCPIPMSRIFAMSITFLIVRRIVSSMRTASLLAVRGAGMSVISTIVIRAMFARALGRICTRRNRWREG